MNKIIKKGKTTIKNGKVYKECIDTRELEVKLKSRYFNSFLETINYENGIKESEYLEDIYLSPEQKLEDLASVVADLHNKTSYQKKIDKEKILEIYNNLYEYVNYLEDTFRAIKNNLEGLELLSPSQNIYLVHYSKIKELINYLKKELDNWKNMNYSTEKIRVCVNHGNLSLDHLRIDKEPKLISLDNMCIDTPVLDLERFYKRYWNAINFNEFLDRYLSKCELTNSEKKLLFILISIPDIGTISNDEIENTIIVTNFINYILNTEEVLAPYYPK